MNRERHKATVNAIQRVFVKKQEQKRQEATRKKSVDKGITVIDVDEEIQLIEVHTGKRTRISRNTTPAPAVKRRKT